MERDPLSVPLSFLVFRILDDEQKGCHSTNCNGQTTVLTKGVQSTCVTGGKKDFVDHRTFHTKP